MFDRKSVIYICLQIFEFPAGWHRHSLGTAKIAYIGNATENNVTVRLVRWTSRIIRAARFCIRRTLSSTSLLHEVHTVLAYIVRSLITALKSITLWFFFKEVLICVEGQVASKICCRVYRHALRKLDLHQFYSQFSCCLDHALSYTLLRYQQSFSFLHIHTHFVLSSPSLYFIKVL